MILNDKKMYDEQTLKLTHNSASLWWNEKHIKWTTDKTMFQPRDKMTFHVHFLSHEYTDDVPMLAF